MKYWYATMLSNDDDDWGNGSYDRAEAEATIAKWKQDGYPDAYIAVIDIGEDGTADPICIEEIR